MAESTQTNERVRRYEIGYLVAPTVPEGEVEEMAEEVADTVSDHGEVLASEQPEMRDLAYTMEEKTSAGEREFNRGQFGWIQFSVRPDALDEIEDAFDDVADIMRHLLVKIDAEDVGGRDQKSEDTDTEDSEEETEDDKDDQ
jgi:ribosomal protein S6